MENEVIVTSELIPIKKINVPELFSSTAAAKDMIAAITIEAKKHEPDLSTASSRKDIASNAYKVSQSKTYLEKLGKARSDQQKIESKRTDSIRKMIRDALDDLRDDVRSPLTQWEKDEEERKAKEAAEKQYRDDWDDALVENDLFNRQKEIERKEAELARIEAERKQKEEQERIEKERQEREKRIAEKAAEMARRKVEEAAKKEQERIEREKKEAVDRAAEQERLRIEAEQKAKEEKERAVKEAEEKMRLEQERIEREKTEKEAAEKAERERKAKHKVHQKSVNNAALVCFVQYGVDEEIAKNVISLIAKGLIDYVTINY